MRLKVGDQWFEAMPDDPIMVEFTDEDQVNLGITRMAPGATRYALFHTADRRSTDQRGRWMDKGARLRNERVPVTA